MVFRNVSRVMTYLWWRARYGGATGAPSTPRGWPHRKAHGESSLFFPTRQ